MSEVQEALEFNNVADRLKKEIGKVIIGQNEVVHQILVSIIANGHCLLVGVPGLAKTLLVKTLSDVLDLKFSRIQFTPDLMPGDITGSEILDENRNFRFVRGPLFAQILLADEINRTPPKTQAALLEAMQERAVTAGGMLHKLEEPFFVLATQNPIEQEGTYPLPEAQLDRFMFNLVLDYPSFEEEMQVVRSTTGDASAMPEKVLNGLQIKRYQQLVRKLAISDNVLEYAVKLVAKTRPGGQFATAQVNNYIAYGAGPRASQYLITGAKTHAMFHGKLSPDIEDVQAVALPVLRHRLVKNFKAEAEGLAVDGIIKGLL